MPGVWVVLCRVDPELAPGEGGRPQPEVSCEAVVLALVPEATAAPTRIEVTVGESGDAVPLDFDTLASLPETITRQGSITLRLGRVGRFLARSANSLSLGSSYSSIEPRQRAAG